MTRAEIIEKGERQLQYILDQAIKYNSKTWAKTGLDQLTMLDYILDEEYEHYSKWFNKFMEYCD